MLKLTDNCAGQKYSPKDVWDIVRGDKITTKLILENEFDQVNRVEYETMTEEEMMLAEKLMNDSNDDMDDIDQTEDTVEFDPLSMIRDGKERSDETGEEGREGEHVVVTPQKLILRQRSLTC